MPFTLSIERKESEKRNRRRFLARSSKRTQQQQKNQPNFQSLFISQIRLLLSLKESHQNRAKEYVLKVCLIVVCGWFCGELPLTIWFGRHGVGVDDRILTSWPCVVREISTSISQLRLEIGVCFGGPQTQIQLGSKLKKRAYRSWDFVTGTQLPWVALSTWGQKLCSNSA